MGSPFHAVSTAWRKHHQPRAHRLPAPMLVAVAAIALWPLLAHAQAFGRGTPTARAWLLPVVVGALVLALILNLLRRYAAVCRRVEALRHENAGAFERLVRSIPDATVVVNEAGEIVAWNPAASALYGYA